MFVQVTVNLPLKNIFDYSVPQHLEDSVDVGKRVWVPFRNRVIVGCIININSNTNIRNTKAIKEVIDETPLLSDDILRLTHWMADYYFCSWGEAIEAAIPSPFKKGKTSIRTKIAESDFLTSEHPDDLVREDMLTLHQNKALTEIINHIKTGEYGAYLLHGITASGKTEVYFRAIEAALKKNKTAIVFVPEIALTPQTIERFIHRFGKDAIAITHSRLSNSEKFVEWQRIKNGEVKIMIGPRSAIFSSLENIGVIVVDEEHENTYKQEDVPRYNLVTTAIKRAQITKAVVILGSATPSLESTYKAQTGIIKRIELPERIKGSDLPTVQIVDMREQSRILKRRPIISKVMEDNINRSLQKKEQVILFLNRRGFSTFIHCSKCGYVVHCKRCSTALVHHFDRESLICHHCDYKTSLPKMCPECNGDYLRYFGTGTQKVESELHRLFPNARIGRMDSDTLAKKTAHFEAFKDFKSRKIDVMVGTQVLAKGLDFPNVTLVGVISADVTLNIPDFRASERTFSLLTQVAGRAGRGKAPGKVIIQTYTPEHYAIQCALKHDYDSFYEQEMVFRKQLKLPPYINMAALNLRSKKEQSVIKTAEVLANMLRKHNKADKMIIMGPSPLPIYKLRGYFRWSIVVKHSDALTINKFLRMCLGRWKVPAQVKLAVDVDPRMIM
ncbi:MAG: primosomal protein N' [PVC group bacterium]|nr:primosomal protein N' [PVC group bacterium]